MRSKLPQFFALLVVVGFCSAYFSRVARADSKPPTTAPSVDDLQKKLTAALDHHLPEVRFNGNRLSDCIDFLRDITDCNIYTDWPALAAAGIKPDAPVTCHLHDVAFSKCLDVILQGLGGKETPKFAPVGNFIVISTSAGLKEIKDMVAAAEVQADDPKLRASMNQMLPELRFNANSLHDVIDFLRDVTGANIFVNWKELESNGIDKDAPITLRISNVSLPETLALIMRQAGTPKATVNFSVDRGVITIGAKSKP